MRAGKLDKTITIESFESGYNEWNEPVEEWVTLGTFRAQIVQASNEEFFIARGVGESHAVVFRTRYIDGVKLTARINYAGQAFNITEVKELGRRQGLDIRAIAPEGVTT